MATIPLEIIENYANALEKLSESAKKQLAEDLSKLNFEGDIALLRDAIIQRVETYLVGYGNMAATLAAAFYDGLRDLSNEKKHYKALLDDSGHEGDTESSVRYLVGAVVSAQAIEDPELRRTALAASQTTILREVCSKIDREIRRAAGDTILLNCKTDPAKPRFARVPAGNDACEFCIMLASQGFVYRTEETAGKHRHYHPNCRCQIVPGFNGLTDIDGYDPDSLYDQWQANEEARKEKGLETISSKSARLRRERAKGSGVTAQAVRPTNAKAAAKAKAKNFGSYGDVSKYINEATSIEDLKERCEVAEEGMRQLGLSSTYMKDLASVVQRKKSSLSRG